MKKQKERKKIQKDNIENILKLHTPETNVYRIKVKFRNLDILESRESIINKYKHTKCRNIRFQGFKGPNWSI